jgi:hypothetical protein
MTCALGWRTGTGWRRFPPPTLAKIQTNHRAMEVSHFIDHVTCRESYAGRHHNESGEPLESKPYMFAPGENPRAYEYQRYQILIAFFGGRGGIRTHGTLSGTPVFKTGALNHSATLPSQRHQSFSAGNIKNGLARKPDRRGRSALRRRSTIPEAFAALPVKRVPRCGVMPYMSGQMSQRGHRPKAGRA